jgi:hypothetical protein
MPDLQRLWDSLLADERRFRYLYYVCTAIVCEQKRELLRLDFAEIMMRLQSMEGVELHTVLLAANELVARDKRKRFVF